MSKPWQPMLAASEIPTEQELQAVLNGGVSIMGSMKLDGIRAPIVGGRAISRKLLPLPNLHFQRWVELHKEHLEGIDCEVISGPSTGEGVFHRTQSAIMSVNGTPDFTLHVFDAFDKTGGPTYQASVRNGMLQKWYDFLPPTMKPIVQLLDQKPLQSIADIEAYMDQALDIGYEGLILKHPGHLYKSGRSTLKSGTLLKYKKFADIECKVVGIKQGKTNTNVKVKDALGHSKRSTAKAGMQLVETCGGFKVWSPVFGEFDAGTGSMTEAQRKDVWNNRDKWIGRTIVVTYQPYGVVGLPRFPSYQKLLAENNLPE